MKNLYTLLLIVCLFLSSCLDKYKDVDTLEITTSQQNFAIPLINTTISIQDALDELNDDSYLNVDEENFMSLVYATSIDSITAQEIVAVPDFSIPVFDTLNIIPLDNNLLPIDLDLIQVKTGTIQISYQSQHNENLEVEFQINNISKDGSFFKYEKSLTIVGNPPFNYTENITLTDHLIDFQSNQFIISYSSKNAAGQHRPLQNITIHFQNLDFNYLQGYFGSHTYELALDTLAIELFEDAIAGIIEVENPILRLIAHNSIGIPSSISSDYFEGESNLNGTIVFESNLDQGIHINAPTMAEVGAFKTTTLLFDNSTSNLNTLINSNPTELRYQLAANINPAADPSIRGFVTDESKLVLDMEVEIPIWLKINDFTLEDTVEFDLEVLSEIKEAEFKLLTENGLPVEVGVQLFFQNSQGITIDSLFSIDDNLLEAGLINADGRVISPTKKEHPPIFFDSNRMSRLGEVTQVVVKGILSTSQNNSAASRFYTDYDLTFQLGVKALVMLEEE